MIFLVRQIAGIIALIAIVFGLSYVSSITKRGAEPISYDSPKEDVRATQEAPETTTTPKKVEATEPVAPEVFSPETVDTPPSQSKPEVKVEVPQAQISIPLIPDTAKIAELNTKVRESVVNILCTVTLGDPLKAITATGVIIDPRGVILTNAHVGQYYLLEDYAGHDSLNCVIRTESPARPAYRGKLLFISSEWIAANKQNLNEEEPLGTGENDFALILITEKIDGSAISETFPALSPGTNDSDIDRLGIIDHVVAAYPAGFLGGVAVERDLYAVSTIARIREIFTFKETTVDLVSLGGNIVAQKGASGGAVVSSEGNKLIGLIVTTTDGATTGERDLRAVTLAHVNRAIQKETGKTLLDYLSGNIHETLRNFMTTSFLRLSAELRAVLGQ